MKLVELHCKSCGATLKPENVVERLAMARCDHCGAVFGIEGLPLSSEAQASRQRAPVPMPPGIEVSPFGGSLEITRRWFALPFVFLAFFCVFWDGFMVAWHAIALSTGAWFMSAFGLLHTAVGVGLTYYTVAGFVNRTVIRAGQGLIEIRHGPLPWPGNKEFVAHEVAQLYSKEKVQHGKNGTQCAYTIHAIMADDRRETLVGGLTEAEQALYIEQQLEQFLGIRDEPVPGELPR
ncbi:MAG: hypothetical protein GX575_22660 [Candidatus Anammoximicrobium sp.]|nr:hypothetical protein [Candidatus Anammoximicrobium sp.]